MVGLRSSSYPRPESVEHSCNGWLDGQDAEKGIRDIVNLNRAAVWGLLQPIAAARRLLILAVPHHRVCGTYVVNGRAQRLYSSLLWGCRENRQRLFESASSDSRRRQGSDVGWLRGNAVDSELLSGPLIRIVPNSARHLH